MSASSTEDAVHPVARVGLGIGEGQGKPDRFYGEPVERFTAMANATDDTPVDRAHFRMWCRIAAEEITHARNAGRR